MRPVDRLHQEHFERFRTLPFPEIGVARALDYSEEHSVSPPSWVVRAASKLLAKLLSGKVPKGKGRHAGHVSAFEQELVDFERWNAVRAVQDIRATARRDDKFLKGCSEAITRSLAKHVEDRRVWLERDNYECAADLLLGRNAFATPRTIKRSFQRINKILDQRETVYTAAWFTESFLKSLGLEGMQEVRRGHKLRLFSDVSSGQAKHHSIAQGITSDRMIHERRRTQKTLGSASSKIPGP
jgi:hypothetical protein